MRSELQARVETAWAELAGLPHLVPRQVIVRPSSLLGRTGWVALVQLMDKLTVAVPTAVLAYELRARIETLPSGPLPAEQILAALPSIAELLGPASLFYQIPSQRLERSHAVQRLARNALETKAFEAALPAADFDESGLGDVTSELFVLHDANGGRVVAACGYERWPAAIAQLCVATLPEHRRRGAGRAVARAALTSAAEEGLLPQWRARPEASKRLARSLGFEELGLQMSVRLG